jgi:sulfoxide reductase heme-binding subunit YedZ
VWTKLIVYILCAVPFFVLGWKWEHNQLGIGRIEYVARYTGDWTLRFLLMSLCITPLRKIRALNGLIKYRRILGLTAFFYGCLHLAHYLYIDKLFDWDDIWVDITMRKFYIYGMLAFSLLIPLALTSHSAAIRWMGGKRWQLLHRLAYLSAILGVVHYYKQGKYIVLNPILYGIGLAKI